MKNRNKVGSTWLLLTLKVLAIIAILWFGVGILIGLRRVSDVSMNGRINAGDFILFDRISDNYSVGDVIIYSHDGQEFMSEIVGEEDDTIALNEDGYLLINGDIISSTPVGDYTSGEVSPFVKNYRVPKGSFFVLNSNYENTDDSRTFGAIIESDIKGVVISLLLRTRDI